ncbi:MAG: hypothetical protein GY904_04540 [Planctomycetaceae bacterium]|nr:hypothetical protein [Planctomycetaceae bacterium]
MPACEKRHHASLLGIGGSGYRQRNAVFNRGDRRENGPEAELGLYAAGFGVLVTIVGLRESLITTPYTFCTMRC